MSILKKIKRRLRTMFPKSIRHSNSVNWCGGKSRKTIIYDSGENNSIIIEDNCVFNRCTFRFFGNDNKVTIGVGCVLSDMTIWIEDNNNEVALGAGTTIHGKTEIACIEGTSVMIGSDCMFSSNIRIRSGDSHTIVNLEGTRINPSKNIWIGNHVWVGQDVFIGKGVRISDNSILGACSVVTRQFYESNIVIGGNPATIIKEKVNWKRERI